MKQLEKLVLMRRNLQNKLGTAKLSGQPFASYKWMEIQLVKLNKEITALF